MLDTDLLDEFWAFVWLMSLVFACWRQQDCTSIQCPCPSETLVGHANLVPGAKLRVISGHQCIVDGSMLDCVATVSRVVAVWGSGWICRHLIGVLECQKISSFFVGSTPAGTKRRWVNQKQQSWGLRLECLWSSRDLWGHDSWGLSFT